jgi:hypothetical protein
MMLVENAHTGARGTDSVTLIDSAVKAAALKSSGVDFVLQYLGSVTPAILVIILEAGLAFMPVTYADRFDGHETVQELAALNIPKGATVWLDVEGITNLPFVEVMAKADAWGEAVVNAGYIAGIYVGANALMTSTELYGLVHITRYWKSQSRVTDRGGMLAEPMCGWCMVQLYPSISWAGIWVDLNFIQEDYENRLPTWVRTTPASTLPYVNETS